MTGPRAKAKARVLRAQVDSGAPRCIRPRRRKARPARTKRTRKHRCQIKRDRGWPEFSMSNTNRSPSNTAGALMRLPVPPQRGPNCPHTRRPNHPAVIDESRDDSLGSQSSRHSRTEQIVLSEWRMPTNRL